MSKARSSLVLLAMAVAAIGCRAFQFGNEQAEKYNPQMDTLVGEFLRLRAIGDQKAATKMLGGGKFDFKNILLEDMDKLYGRCFDYEPIGIGFIVNGFEDPKLQSVSKTIQSECGKGRVVESFHFRVQPDGTLVLSSYTVHNSWRLMRHWFWKWWSSDAAKPAGQRVME